MTMNTPTEANARGETTTFEPHRQSLHLNGVLKSKVDPEPYLAQKTSYSFEIEVLREGIQPSFDLREVNFEQVAGDCGVDAADIHFCIISRDNTARRRTLLKKFRSQEEIQRNDYWAPSEPIKSASGFSLFLVFVLNKPIEQLEIASSDGWISSDPTATKLGSILSSRTYSFIPVTDDFDFPILKGKEDSDGNYNHPDWYIRWRSTNYNQPAEEILEVILKPHLHDWFKFRRNDSLKSKQAPARLLLVNDFMEEIYLKVISDTNSDGDNPETEDFEEDLSYDNDSFLQALIYPMEKYGLNEERLRSLVGDIMEPNSGSGSRFISREELRMYIAKVSKEHLFQWENLGYGT